MSKAPHYMNSYFPTKCADCGKSIATGEMIYWESKGVVKCVDCAPDVTQPEPETIQQVANQSASNSGMDQNWLNALILDESPKAKPAQASPKPAQSTIDPPKPEPQPKPESPKVAQIQPASDDSGAHSFDDLLNRPNGDSKRTTPSDHLAQLSTGSDNFVRMVANNLQLLEVSLFEATELQRDAIQSFARQKIADSDNDSSGRYWSSVWQLVETTGIQ